MGTTAPFGYRKDPQDKNYLIVDEVTAPTVRLIYSLALEGHGTNRIGKVLYERKIPKPSYYNQEFFSQHDTGSEVEPYPSEWNACLSRANREKSDEIRPDLKETVENMEEYDVLFLGYPNMEQGFESVLCVSCSKKGRKRNSMHKRQ